jgi:hypothetical protein
MLALLMPTVETALRMHVETWLRLLSVGDWRAAVSMLDGPNSYGIQWGEAEIRNSIDEYARGKLWCITSPETLHTSGCMSLGEFTDGSGYYFYCDIPLNGEWSDLTAQFEFIKLGNGYAFVLHDMHVL